MVFIGYPQTMSTLTLKHCNRSWGMEEFGSCVRHVENWLFSALQKQIW